MSERVYGIDLGTTYSAVAYINQKIGMPEIIGDQYDSTQNTASNVFFYDTGDPDDVQTTIGYSARQEAKLSPERAVSAFKRFMNDDDWSFDVDGKSYSPVDLSAIVLEQLAARASESVGQVVKNVIITVPAYFGTKEREKTALAGERAGLNVVDIIAEPTAAALAYGLSSEEEGSQTILVYDLGGGTFDVTIMEFQDRTTKSLSVKGDHNLGGVLWDQDLAMHWAEWIANAAGTGESAEDIFENPETHVELMQVAEKAKQRLTNSKAEVKENIKHGNDNFRVSIDNETFDALTEGRLARSMDLVDEAIEVARAKKQAGGGELVIDKVLLVGGSTMMPQVKRRLRSHIGEDAEIELSNPHLSVALGAAVYGQKREVDTWIRDFVKIKLESEGKTVTEETIDEVLADPESPELVAAVTGAAEEFKTTEDEIALITESAIIDVAPKSVGIMHLVPGKEGRFATNFLTTQQEIPAKHTTDRYSTVADNQESVKLVCLENNRTTGPDDEPHPFDEREVIGDLTLQLGAGLPKGTQIEITIEFSETGRITLHGRDTVHGKEISGEFDYGASELTSGA